MEAKRLGLCQKSLFVVPNHLTEQWASEFLRLYPSANILVTTKKDFETHNRKKFCALSVSHGEKLHIHKTVRPIQIFSHGFGMKPFPGPA